ncbi:MAG TPA: cell division protein ZipA C-terminal FtsZ-binding domain-containing protein [Acidiferrobacteraceae bacterium]|nr:cell division protein ZipA C-terminal FtsZ-binding domain-containing protein [Acidiferrobacteraceae bacterium]
MSIRLVLGLFGAVVVAAVGASAYDGGWRKFLPFSGRGRRPPPGRGRWPARPQTPAPEEPPQRVMVDDGNGGRVVYGRRWLESRGPQPEVSMPVPKPAPVPIAAGLCMPDEAIDFIVRLPGRQPVVRDQVLGIYRQEESLIERRHRLCGLRFGTSLSVNLDTEAAEGQYSDLVLSVQLADHRGMVTEADLNRITQIGLQIADATQRQPQFSISFEEALARAADLDRFCSAFDMVASISIVAQDPEGFAGNAVHEAAVAEGLEFGDRRIFHFRSDTSHPLFSLANLFKPGDFDPLAWATFRTRGLALFLDVPCVEHPEEAFDRMVALARALAARLGGDVLDQERRPLTPELSAVIRTQISKIAENMDRYNISAGSPRALRLFGL